MNVEEIRQWIAEGDLDPVETAWMEALEDPPPPRQMREVLAALAEAGRAETAATFGELYLLDAGDRLDADDALEIARSILPMLTETPQLREVAIELYRAARGQDENFPPLLRASGLGREQTFRRALRTLDTCLALRAGSYLAGRLDQRVARVEGFDPQTAEFVLTDPGGQKLTREAKLLADEFECTDEDDFRIVSRFRPDDLPKLLASDPGKALIGLCMAHGGQIDAHELKDLLADTHIEPGKWSSWWNRARSAAKRSELLGLTGRNPVTITYHPHGRSLEEELAEAAGSALLPLDHLAVLRRYARELAARRGQVDPDFAGPIVDALARQAESFRGHRFADALDAALAIDDAVAAGMPRPTLEYPSAAELLAEADEPAEAVGRLTDPSLGPLAVEAVAARTDGPEQLIRLLPLMPAEHLDDLARHLRQAGRAEAVAAAVADAASAPAQNLQICLWLWRGPAEQVPEAPSPLRLLSGLLGALEEYGRDDDMDRARRREAYQQVRSAIVADSCGGFRAAMGEMDEGIAATVKRRVERCDGLTDTVREKLLSALREEFHQLFVEEKAPPWEDERVIWTTAEGMARQEAKLKDILEVQLPANARAIGAAAAHGDLSDNSEFQFAIEEKRRLEGRVAALQNELTMARVLHPQDVPGDSVGVGSRVVLKRLSDGREVQLAFLGPWDTDLAAGVLNYQTPLAQSLMGKSVGEAVTLKLEGAEGEYTIERVAPAL